MFKPNGFLFLVPLICSLVSIQAQTNTNDKLSISKLFSDKMILQQNSNIPLWGKSAPNEKVFIYTSWGPKQSTTASELGEWKVNIKTLGASYKQHQITVHGMNQDIKINNVLIGEVWLASGQSNMEMDFNYCCNTTDYSAKEMQSANFPAIRMFNVKKRVEKIPTNIVEGNWIAALGKDITNFSAAAYFFAKKLHEKLDVPVGIIHASWGGSDAEAWISKKKLSSITFTSKDDNQKNIDGTSKTNNLINFDTNDAFIKQVSKAEKWFSMFNRVDLQSIIYYLNIGLLGDYFSSESHWLNLDTNDSKYLSPGFDKSDWNEISVPGSFQNIFGDNNFKGVIVLKKDFYIKDLSNNYSIELGKATDVDFTYVNGNLIGNTIGKNAYRKKVYGIPKSYLNIGKNEIIIRLINQDKPGYIGQVNLINTTHSRLSLAGKWRYKISAEIYRQMSNYRWPYDAFYLYDKKDIDFSLRPPNVKCDGRTSKGGLYNGMIHPIIPYKIKGVIWYQGENNVQRYEEYKKVFTSLIADWREAWDYIFPFYFVQIAPFYNYNGKSPMLREAQRKTLTVEKTGMVVTLDIGEDYDIHPSNKHDVGYRLARLALANDYNQNLIPSGPKYIRHFAKNNKLNILFDMVGSGLLLDGYTGFEIAGDDGIYLNASVSVLNDTLVAWNTNIDSPKHFRYAWQDMPKATLFNSEMLPASSFSTE